MDRNTRGQDSKISHLSVWAHKIISNAAKTGTNKRASKQLSKNCSNESKNFSISSTSCSVQHTTAFSFISSSSFSSYTSSFPSSSSSSTSSFSSSMSSSFISSSSSSSSFSSVKEKINLLTFSSKCFVTDSLSAVHIPPDLYSCSSSDDENFEKKNPFEKPTFKEQLVFAISLADKISIYKEMEKLINQFVRTQEAPSHTLEKNQLLKKKKQALQALKNYTFVKRTENQVLNKFIEDEKESDSRGSKQGRSLLKLYRNMITKESMIHCNKAISLFLDVLLPKATNVKMKIFYMKMGADYCRYNTEFNDLLRQDKYKQKAEQLYLDAMNMAYNSLPAYDTILLNTALNYAKYNYETLNNEEKAINIAKKAFNDAIEQIDDISDADYKETVVLLYIIKGYITAWKQSFYEQKSIFII